MDIEAMIQDLRARMKEQGQLTELLWTLNDKGEIVAVKIKFIGKTSKLA